MCVCARVCVCVCVCVWYTRPNEKFKAEKKRSNPWKTHDIIKIMYERDHADAKATQGNDSKLWQDYRNLRNKVTSIIKERKNAYFNYIYALGRDNPKKMWSEIKRLVPGKNKHSHIT